MSTMHLSRLHLEILAAAATELGIAQVHSGQGCRERVADVTSTEGALLFGLLKAQHRATNALPDCLRVSLPEDGPDGTAVAIGGSAWELGTGGRAASNSASVLPSFWKTDPQQCVQIIQWVRCYVYQCSSDQRWRGSAAESVCTQMINGLLDLLAMHFRAKWVPED